MAEFASLVVSGAVAMAGLAVVLFRRPNRPFALGLLVLVLVVHLRWCLLDWVIVDGPSMKPALSPGSIAFVRKGGVFPPVTPFLHRSQLRRLFPLRLNRGAAVVVRYPGLDGEYTSRLVKRIAALPGDDYEFKDNAFFLNGRKAIEGIEASPTRIQPPPSVPPASVVELGPLAEYAAAHGAPPRGTVPANSVLILGDNAGESRDSRSIGFVPLTMIEGEVIGEPGGVHVPNAQ